MSGPVRLDRRTKRLASRLRPGDIAVIDHVDLDRVAADSLVAAGVGAVLNAKPSISGRYPNLGPEVLVRAGIPLVDDLGEELFQALREGDQVRIDGGDVYLGEERVASGVRQNAESVAKAMAEAREGLSVQLEAFAANTMEYLRQERELLLDGVGVPEVETPIAGRHCLIVVRGYDYQADLDVLRPYIREFRPVLIGVDGGADALVEAGYTPDLIVGDMDSVTDEVLRCGAELVVHAYPDGRAPGLARVEKLGLSAHVFPAAATSEDIAMLLADERERPYWWRSAPTPLWWSSWTRGGVAWPPPSSPACGSAVSWSTPRGSAGSTGRAFPDHRCCCWCWRRWQRWRRRSRFDRGQGVPRGGGRMVGQPAVPAAADVLARRLRLAGVATGPDDKGRAE